MSADQRTVFGTDPDAAGPAAREPGAAGTHRREWATSQLTGNAALSVMPHSRVTLRYATDLYLAQRGAMTPGVHRAGWGAP